MIARELEAIAPRPSEPELHAFFARPWVTSAAKRAVAAEVATRLQVSKLAKDFSLVAAQGRADHLEAIVAAYRELPDEAEGRVRARAHRGAAQRRGRR